MCYLLQIHPQVVIQWAQSDALPQDFPSWLAVGPPC